MEVVFDRIEKNTMHSGDYYSVSFDVPEIKTLTHGSLYSGEERVVKQMANYLKYGEELRDGIAAAISALGSNLSMSELEILTDKLNKLYEDSGEI